MGKKMSAMVLLVVCQVMMAIVNGYEEQGKGRFDEKSLFLLQKTKHVVKTEAGEMTVVEGFGRRISEKPLHVSFITMEPKSLFVPQYLDANLVLFVRRGEVTVGSIYKDDLVEKRLGIGDIYTVEAGSTFYLVNTGEGQILHLVCGIDSLEWGDFQSFFIGGGTYPTSVLSGFDRFTLSTALNVSVSELEEFLTGQQSGPIVYLTDSHPPNVWNKIFQLKERQRLQHLKAMMGFQTNAISKMEEPTWSIRKILNSMFRERTNGGDKATTKSPDPYNIYESSPGFKNDYGWSTAIGQSEYAPLKHIGLGVYIVNLTAGSMLAPHINPTATEYGIVLRGSGTIQVVFPNGTLAMNAKVTEGDVFWIPRYFPFCQVASRTGPFEFFGFSTSAEDNLPQFLAGVYSLLQALRGPECAASFGVSEEKLTSILDSQKQSVILPSVWVSPEGEGIRRVAGDENGDGV